MVIRNAGIEDLELLVRLRLDYLSESRALDETETAHLSEKLRGYFARQLTCGGFAAILALEGDTALSTAFLSVAERPPRTAAGTCLVGTVYNVYTNPEYRRRGLATQVMRALIEAASSLGAASLDMPVSPDGRLLYEQLGFQISKYTPMRMNM